MPVITSKSGCPDLRTGANCSETWFEDLEPYTTALSYVLFIYNVILFMVTFALLVRYLFGLQFCQCCLRGSEPGSAITRSASNVDQEGLRRQVSYIRNYDRLKKIKLRSNLHRRLVIVIFSGSCIQELCHIVFYMLRISMEYTFEEDVAEDNREIFLSYFLAYTFSFGLCVAFSTSFATTVLFQKIISSPLANLEAAKLLKQSKALNTLWSLGRFNLVKISNVRDLAIMLCPVWISFCVVWICLGLGLIKTPIFFLRIVFGILSLPLLIQGIFLALTGRRLVAVVNEMLVGFEGRILENEEQKISKENYKSVKSRMNIYTKVMEQLLISNGLLGIVLVCTKLFHEPLGFFIIILMFNFSLAGFGTVVVILFFKQKEETSQRSRPKTMKVSVETSNNNSAFGNADPKRVVVPAKLYYSSNGQSSGISRTDTSTNTKFRLSVSDNL